MTVAAASHKALHLLAAYGERCWDGSAAAGGGGGRVARRAHHQVGTNTLHAQSPVPLAVNSKLERNFIVHVRLAIL